LSKFQTGILLPSLFNNF